MKLSKMNIIRIVRIHELLYQKWKLYIVLHYFKNHQMLKIHL